MHTSRLIGSVGRAWHSGGRRGAIPSRTVVVALACVWIVLAWACVARAQSASYAEDPEYLISRWETDDGLPDSSATAMVQDRQGHLWVGTFRGLARFDGVGFTVFDPTNTPAIPHAGVVSLHLDGAGRLWVGTLGGMAMMEQGVWTPQNDEAVKGMVVRAFAERANGDMLITDFTGGIVEYSAGRFRKLPAPPGQPGRGYLASVSERGRWWVAQVRFIGEWDGQRWNEVLAVPRDHVAEVSCAASRDGGVWILVDRQLTKLRGGAIVSRIELGAAPGGLWGLFEDSLGNVWISTYDGGLWRVNPAGAMRRWTSGEGLGHNGIRFVFEDREGTVWVGSSGGGLSRFKKRRFEFMKHADVLKEASVNSLHAAKDGSVWIATYGNGLFRVDGSTVTPVPVVDEAGIGVGYLQSVLVDRLGRRWVGTYEGGVCILEGNTRTWVHSGTGGKNVVALFEDSRGRVWMGGGKSVGVCSEGSFREFGGNGELPRGAVRCIGEDGEGNVWVSDGTGVFRFEGERFLEVPAEGGSSIPDVVSMRAGDAGAMWLGTSTRGLLRWKDGRTSRIQDQAWPAAGVFGIVEDGEGYWWMPSEVGVVRARREELERVAESGGRLSQIQLFDRRDGMVSSDCTAAQQPSVSRDVRGRLWFASAKGVAVIDPAMLRLNEVPPPTTIDGLAYSSGVAGRDAERPRLRRPAPGVAAELPAGSRGLEIRYSGLSYVSPEKVKFQVMLSSVDADWHDVGERRSVFYDELSPGSYVFKVRAANNDGLWGPPSQLEMEVAPQFWETWTFRGAAVGFTIALSVLVTWWLLRAHHERAKEQLELRQHRQEMIHLTRVNMLGELSGALAHELSQPLTAILSNAQAAQRFLAQDPAETGEVGEILTDIVNENRRAGEIILRLRQLLKKGEVTRQPLEVAQVLDDVLRLSRSELINRNVVVVADLPDDLPLVHGDRVQVEQVLLNLIVNAIDAMTGDTQQSVGANAIVVRARAVEDQRVQVSVVDNGPGIPAEQLDRIFEPFVTTKSAGMGLGLSICRTIVSAHGGRIWADNNPDRGATLHFTLQVHAENR